MIDDIFAEHKSNGNVLFLILIAVALFAALSYAVTSSTRTGEGTAGTETSTLNSAQVIQECSNLRQQVTRFIFNGVSDSQIQMNIGADPTVPCRTGSQCLFSPDGGNAIIPIPPQLKGSKGALPPAQMAYEFYAISDGEYLEGYASDKSLVMFTAVNLSYDFCKKINKSLGLDEEPVAINTPDANFRDSCVVSVGQFLYRCPLTH